MYLLFPTPLSALFWLPCLSCKCYSVFRDPAAFLCFANLISKQEGYTITAKALKILSSQYNTAHLSLLNAENHNLKKSNLYLSLIKEGACSLCLGISSFVFSFLANFWLSRTDPSLSAVTSPELCWDASWVISVFSAAANNTARWVVRGKSVLTLLSTPWQPKVVEVFMLNWFQTLPDFPCTINLITTDRCAFLLIQTVPAPHSWWD